jgi:DDE superfamily endonuclease
MDEHRVGLKPVIRRVWACKGNRPIIRVQQRYEWLYVYGFLHPETGVSHWLLLPSVNVEIFNIALAHFAQAVDAGLHRRIILVLDRAGWHESGEVVVPEGIHLVFLPPTHRSYNPVNGYGRFPTRPLPIGASKHWMSCKRCKQSDALPCKTIRPVSVTPRSFIGGLSRPPKKELIVSNPILQ